MGDFLFGGILVGCLIVALSTKPIKKLKGKVQSQKEFKLKGNLYKCEKLRPLTELEK